MLHQRVGEPLTMLRHLRIGYMEQFWHEEHELGAYWVLSSPLSAQSNIIESVLLEKVVKGTEHFSTFLLREGKCYEIS